MKGPAWVLKTMFFLALAGTVVALAAVAGLYVHYAKDLPKMITVEEYKPPIVTRVVAPAIAAKPGQPGQDAVVIGEFFKERRYLVPYEKIPDTVIRAFISAEDDKFFEHPGINLASIVRAAVADLRAGHSAQGGSTITQQVTRSLLLTREKTLLRKIKEIILSYRMEKNLSKQQILYLYLNQIYLGHGSYGVEAASRPIFEKAWIRSRSPRPRCSPASRRRPENTAPSSIPSAPKSGRSTCSSAWRRIKYISEEQMAEAVAEPLRIFHDEESTTSSRHISWSTYAAISSINTARTPSTTTA